MFFYISIACVILVPIVYMLWFLKKHLPNYRAEQYIRSKLLYEPLLLDEMIVRCDDKEIFLRAFQELSIQTLEDRRVWFCFLCIHETKKSGVIEVAMLTREIVEKHSSLIATLPEHLQDFYKTDVSIYDLDPNDTLVVVDDRVIEKEVEYSPEELRSVQELYLEWLPIDISKNVFETISDIEDLIEAIECGEIIIRFKKKIPSKGKTKKEEKELKGLLPVGST